MAKQRTIKGCGLPSTVPAKKAVTMEACDRCAESFIDVGLFDGCGDGRYCGPCYRALFVPCCECQRPLSVSGDMTRFAPGCDDPFCAECYEALYHCCDGCGTSVRRSESRPFTIGVSRTLNYCDRCYDDRFTECCGCGTTIYLDEVAYTDEYDGDSYCRECAPSDEDEDGTEWGQGRNVQGQTYTNIGSRRKYGVELEISGCNNHAGLRGNTVFGVKYDGSLSGGKEFVSPILQGDEGLTTIDNLCEYGKTHNWTVDSSCGYHLHCDCSDLDPVKLRRLAYAYVLTEQLWKRFVSKKRSRNTYCKSGGCSAAYIRNNDWEDILNEAGDRYVWLNWVAYRQHHTVEVRLHSGTVNAVKVSNWVKVHLRFIDAVINLSFTDLDKIFKDKSIDEQFVNLAGIIKDDALMGYYEKRAAKHKQPLAV